MWVANVAVSLAERTNARTLALGGDCRAPGSGSPEQ